MSQIALDIKNISKKFSLNKPQGLSLSRDKSSSKQNQLVALDDVSFSVNKGEILGIIGLNGSGKTTLLRIISGIYKPNSGSVDVYGKLTPILQIGTGFQGDLNANDNIMMNGLLMGMKKSEIVKKIPSIMQFSELEKFSKMKLKHFSSGMRSRLAFATAIQVDFDILLLDEVLSVGDKIFREKCYDTFMSMKRERKTILHTTHNIQKLAEFSDRVLLLHKGKIVKIGKPYEVLEMYNEITKTARLDTS